ncbi:ADP-ribosylglycohydrolase family protein [Arthrobacter sp. ISL-65]|uniref:ADP-ribosylglycohydrolase family protein n=1 Tax=Arthrobacter sp. ISL-65 TaxID=2819112 RepID=UPI001BE7693D|nr:ADP-ribosylglycohydrolase family protein [Arthrobacter sp. ISL-65]MBT2547910.1 ADP-ribosylglycohydrolase family protein [Arthrobacter sp. ISL-65]
MSNVPGTVPSPESRIHGCLLGGALGDSLGYAVEFDPIDEIRRRFGAAGLRDFSALDGGTHFSDDTQMTLYTVDGIVEALEWANSGVGADANACVWLAYLRWLDTQGVPVPESAPRPQSRWIDGQDVLRHRRAPGNACLSGLATGQMGTIVRPVNPDSKGCGTVMRSAPFGLVPHIPAEAVYKLSSDAASLTHGHPSARQSAGAFSLLIHYLVQGSSLAEASQAALARVLADDGAAPELRERLDAAIRLAGQAGADPVSSSVPGSVLSPEELVRALGEGWVAEEALAVGLYAVLATATASEVNGEPDPVAHFKAAIALAINHSGDSDSTGSIAGNILGAYYGTDCLPADWLEALEAPEVIRGMAGQLVAVTSA